MKRNVGETKGFSQIHFKFISLLAPFYKAATKLRDKVFDPHWKSIIY